MIYTDAQLIHLARSAPKELMAILLSPNTNMKMLVAGAEILCGESTDETAILPVIKLLIIHKHALVRESTLNGVAAFYNINNKPPKDIIDKLIFISTNDPSVDLKNYAKELLKDII